MKKTAKNPSINLTRKIFGAAIVATFMASSSQALAEEFVISLGDMGGRPLIDVYIGDNGPYTMIFDTGAPSVILNQDIGKELGLEVVGEQRVGSPGGQGMQAVLYEGQTITIGDYSFEVDQITGMDFSALMGGPRPAGNAASGGQPVRRVMGGPQPEGETPENGKPVRRVMGGPQKGGPAGGPGPVRMAAPPPGVLGFWTLDQGVVGINFV
ncbi:MAG: aspartyl protease family protein, partial [Alphaproteobacteria bacterium]